MRQVTFAPTFEGWKKAARHALQQGVPPEDIIWQELFGAQPSLDLGEEAEDSRQKPTSIRVPKDFVQLAATVACHREESRWALLYRTLWRLTHEEKNLLQIVVDPDVHRLLMMAKAIRRDIHKMRAFVRFREVKHGEASWYVAWFEPEHHIVEANAPFFVDRFAGMHWSILTPDRCAHWDGKQLNFTNGVPRSEAPTEDKTEELWKRYYSHIFNPARVKVHAMQTEMPKKYWKNLPEAAVIPSLLNEAPKRVEAMMAKSRAKPPPAADDEAQPAPVPASTDLDILRQAAAHCTACPLYKNATQTVFGEGRPHARLVLVGEQPGDQEDLAGHPFVGPAGQLLDRALAEAGIDRKKAYVTNAVKHFKWEPVGQRRLHKKPSSREIAACRPWLRAELEALQPEVVICLGATAAQSVIGPQIRVMSDRGSWFKTELCARTTVTMHPSSLLRAPDEATREANYQLFVADLRLGASALGTT
jgi:DNA polymerase